MVSRANLEVRPYVPSDMSRKPRSLSDIDRWKATEFRLLLLYTGPAVLRSRIPKPLMDNFLTLHCAVTILCSPLFCTEHLEYAEKLMRHFVETYITLYGRHAVSHNVHGLIHVANDVRAHGSLHSYSAFPFENYMRKLKSYVRKPEKPLQQVYNRIVEERFSVPCSAIDTAHPFHWIPQRRKWQDDSKARRWTIAVRMHWTSVQDRHISCRRHYQKQQTGLHLHAKRQECHQG